MSPTGKSFRFVSCVRACVRAVLIVRLDSAEKERERENPFAFSLLVSQPFPFSLSSNQVVSVS